MTNKEAIEVLQSMKLDFPLPKAAQTRRAQNDALDAAIKALKAEPCSDTISRQAAIDALKRISFSYYFECGEYLSEDTREIEIINSNKALEAIKALPPAQPEQRWIPVTERPPKKGQKCLVSDKGCIAIDTFWGRGGAYNWQFYVRDYEAWMPLVEPYNAKRRNESDGRD